MTELRWKMDDWEELPVGRKFRTFEHRLTPSFPWGFGLIKLNPIGENQYELNVSSAKVREGVVDENVLEWELEDYWQWYLDY